MDTTNRKTANIQRMLAMPFGGIYPLYVAKAEKKGRTAADVDLIIQWLTGYKDGELHTHLANGTSVRDFFDGAPDFNPAAYKITGTICGYRIEEIEDPLVRKIRYLDKLVDELAKGKPMEKILRQ